MPATTRPLFSETRLPNQSQGQAVSKQQGEYAATGHAARAGGALELLLPKLAWTWQTREDKAETSKVVIVSFFRNASCAAKLELEVDRSREL